jgi:hypothetical protein
MKEGHMAENTDPVDVTEAVVEAVAAAEAEAPAVVHAPSLDTTHPSLNVASRDNIVPSGPGSVADYLPR